MSYGRPGLGHYLLTEYANQSYKSCGQRHDARLKSQWEKLMAQKMAEAPIVNAWSTKSTVPFFRTGNNAPVSTS